MFPNRDWERFESLLYKRTDLKTTLFVSVAKGDQDLQKDQLKGRT